MSFRLAPLALVLALSACSLVGPDSDALVEWTVRLPTADAAALDFEVAFDGEPLDRAAFDASSDGRQFDARALVADAGSTALSCTLARESARSTVTLRLDLQRDWSYRVWCLADAADRAELCMGCRGSESVAVDPGLGLPDGTRLYLVWGGDPTDEPVLY